MCPSQAINMKNSIIICWSVAILQAAVASSQTSATQRPTVASTQGDYTGEPHHPHISDHRFFLHEIFTKYGHDGQMTFEGFEHLLESLGLGNIIINDHDVTAHKEEKFRNIHDTHDHSKKHDENTQSSKRNDRDHEHEKPLKRKGDVTVRHVPGTTENLHSSNYMGQTEASKLSTSTIKYQEPLSSAKTTVHHSHPSSIPPVENLQQPETTSGTKIKEDKISALDENIQNRSTSPSDSLYRYYLKEVELPELLVNISSLVDQHQELEEEKTPGMIIEQCLSPKDILETFGINQTSSLNPVSFLHLCPAIIYELDQGHCLFRDRSHSKHKNIVTVSQWLYACLAVVAISLCGLFSVAVIPIMQKWFYHTLLQFLVGLAVGSLSGDALLHLMPHAMLGGEGDHDHGNTISAESAEKTAVWRGFAALGGIFFFFIAERLLGAFATYKKQKKEAKVAKSSKIIYSANFNEDFFNGSVGKKLSQYRKNSYDFIPNQKETMHMLENENSHSSQNSVIPQKDGGFHDHCHLSKEPNGNTIESALVMSNHHGHGHSHEIPQSVTAVAWMVIMGDGLHNFCDGLAIGVAFASGIEGGISTTVAVFCHELPHELGDFAMLLKTGMKVKQALFYNGLSSVLCFIGMVIGVSLGNVQSATSCVFAGTAGMFLYIALVDMLPELSANVNDPDAAPGYQLAVQVLGISTGVSIMLLIANYEQDLQTIIS